MSICNTEICTCLYHPLLNCIENGANDEAKYLLQKLGNCCDLADDSGFTLLHYAARYGNEEMAQVLIDGGCNVNAADYYEGFTPLMVVIGNTDVRVVEILLNNNADIYVTNCQRVSSLQLSIHCYLYSNASGLIEKYSRIFEMLFERLSRDFLSGTNDMAQSILSSHDEVKLAAVVFGNAELTRFLLSNGYPIDFHEPKNHYTALHCAEFFGRTEKVRMLIERGANVFARNRFGRPSLYGYMNHLEAVDENSEVLKLFLKREDIKSFLRSREGRKDGALLLQFGKTETVRAVLASGIDGGEAFGGGSSCLHLVIQNQNVDPFDVKGELDGKCHMNSYDVVGHTPLIAAVRCSYVRKVEFLLQKGADVNFTLPNGESACAHAAWHALLSTSEERKAQHGKILELLLLHGADVRFSLDHCQNFVNKLFRSDNLLLSKMIAAHLALISTFDRKLSTDESYAINSIMSDAVLNAHFDSCMQQLEKTKNVQIHGNVNLFELLTEKREKIAAHARNEQLMLALNSKIKELSYLEPYYLNTLRNRIAVATYKVQLDRKAILACERLTGLSSDAYHHIVYNIIRYLSFQDLHCLSKV